MLTAVPHTDAKLSGAVWIDLVDATDEERARVEKETGLRLPSRADLEEIESSSRVYAEDGTFYLSSPVLESSDCVNGGIGVVGFVLSPRTLVTLRFGRTTSFDVVAAAAARATPASDGEVFVHLLEAIIDHAADALEHAAAELEQVSHESFRADHPRRKKAKTSEALRGALRRIGRMGDGLSHVRDMLLGLGRIATFVRESRVAKLPDAEAARLEGVRADIASLNDYEGHLTAKVQFLLDATLGFINIEQNDVVKTLTVASVVGVPPVLIAGVYGMNFKHIPEFDWTFGYPYALIVIVASVLIPLAWFKWRSWM